MDYTTGIGKIKMPDDPAPRWYAFRHDDPEARYPLIGDTAADQLPRVKQFSELMKTGQREQIYRNISVCIKFPEKTPPGMRQEVADQIFNADTITLGNAGDEVVAADVAEGADEIWEVLAVAGEVLFDLL